MNVGSVLDRAALVECVRQGRERGLTFAFANGAFDLLHVLIRERPNVISKAALMKALWPDTFVEENNLATLITDLRTALGDHARDAKLIRTAHGVANHAFQTVLLPVE